MYLLIKGYIVLVVIVLHTLQTVHGGYMVSVRIFQYINPNGTCFEHTTIIRRCCDGPQREDCQTGDKCDTFFDICVGEMTNNKCKGAFFQTRPEKDTNYFANLAAMTAMSEEVWITGRMSINIFVRDDDSNSTVQMHDHIDTIAEKLPPIIPAVSESESTEYRLSFHQSTILNMYIRVWCAENYYGYGCDVYCQDIAPMSKCNNTGFLQCLDDEGNKTERILIGASTLTRGNYQKFCDGIKQLADDAICQNKNETKITSLVPDFRSQTVSFLLTCKGVRILPLEMESSVRLLNSSTLMNLFHQPVDFGSSIKAQGYGQHGDPNVFVSVEILEYANPAGRSYVGTNTTGGRRCCDLELASKCNFADLCDTTISVCIGRLSESECFGAFVETAVYMNTNSLTTCGSVLLDRTTQQTFIQHPMIGAMRLTTKTTTVIAIARDFDLEEDGFDLIDGVAKNINLTFSPNLTAATILEVDMSNYIVLKLKIIFWCAPGYEGENCTVSKGSFTCEPGWTGDGCEEKDECQSNPCMHGICQNTIGSFICNCDKSWSGSLCETFHYCWLNPCRHGICNELDNGSYNCVCDPGYTGHNCSVNIDDCVSNSCMNNATCIDAVNNFTCVCLLGFVGNLCENKICENVSCSDHGVCQILSGHDASDFECICKRGWTGLFCERDENECLENICEHNGTCTNFNGSFSCSCSQFWTGERCDVDIDECSSSPCKNQGTCHNQRGANFTCSCDSGWTGPECSVNLNECNRNPISCLHGRCVDTLGSYRCDCENGWIGENCSKDRNECQENLNICGKGNCTNYSGGYNCNCWPGFRGRNCSEDVDECLVVLCGHGNCTNFPGGYKCECEKGYNGTHCEDDVNECLESPCIYSVRCTNLPGDYDCTCSPGFRGRNCSEDVNECLVVLCGHGNCTNFPGGYKCECEKGYNGTHCEDDVNECMESPCIYSVRCTNIPGDYHCTCSPGWSGRNCTVPNDQYGGKCHELQMKFAYAIQQPLENKINRSIQAFVKKSACPSSVIDIKVISISESLVRFVTTCGGTCMTESQLQTALESLTTSDKSAMFPIPLADSDPLSPENGNSDPLNQAWVPVLIGCSIAFGVIVAIGVILCRRKKRRSHKQEEERNKIVDDLQFENPTYDGRMMSISES